MKANRNGLVFKITILSFVLTLISSCNQYSPKENLKISDAEVTENFEAVSIDDSKAENKEFIPENLKIIKSGKVRYKVTDIQASTHQIRLWAYNYNAYISDMRFEDNLHRKENRFTIKVPAKYFDSLLDSIGNVAEFVDYENITTQDVTEEYLDLETRLKTKREVKSRLEDILRRNAKTVEDILATEDRLSDIQEEIEVVQGRLNYLSSKVVYNSIQVDLYEAVDFKEEPTVYKKTFWDKTKESFAFGLNFMESFLLGIFHLWPFLILGTFFFHGYKKRWFRKK